MSFKENLKKDVLSNFLNEDELAEMHNVAGRDMLITIDDYELQELQVGKNAYSNKLSSSTILFYCHEKEFNYKLPKAGTNLLFDKNKMKISYAIREGLMFKIALEEVENQ